MRDFTTSHTPHRLASVRNILLAAAGMLAGSGLVSPPKSLAQSAASARPEFEVASIKRQTFTGQGFVGIRLSGNRLQAEHQSLGGLITYAYGIEGFQLSGGPPWVYSSNLNDPEMYEVSAKAEGETAPSPEQFRQMLKTLLTDRFQLNLHRETKDLPAYELVLAKTGSKLKDATADPNAQTNWISGRAIERYSAKKRSMTDLAFVLRSQTGRPVLDKTGLTGRYDFELQWAPDPPSPDATAPSIFTAVQEQLGLKLESVRAPFDVWVIDHAEKPSGN